MKLNDDLVVLPLPIQRDGQTNYLNVSLILDAENGHTLVDTGLPGQMNVIAEALAEEGLSVNDIKRIIITHQDIDHIGSLHDLVSSLKVPVLASATETPMIDGTTLPRFARPEILEARPEMRPIAERFRPTSVDQQLQPDERLDLAGGVRVVFTPGHTPGHMCLYLERSRSLIAGDALTSENGELHGPNPGATQDIPTASQSVAALAALDVATIVCYHGGVVDADANEQLQRVSREVNAS